MTSFGWKRKSGLNRSSTAAVFCRKGEESDGDDLEEEGVDWLTAAKRRKLILLEDSITKSKRLQNEGGILAENGRYWEAMKYWNEALQLTPDSTTLLEMKAQALMEVGEVFEAVQCAEMAVNLCPTWATARQTLGRAQLGIGEVHMALRNFEKAVHLDPTCSEIWSEDLQWTWELSKEKDRMNKADNITTTTTCENKSDREQ